MTVSSISITEPVREQLRRVLLEERDFIDSVRGHPHEAIEGQPGRYRCACKVAVRRPFDPETAELREIEVTIERMQDGWVVSKVEGLGEGIETGEIGIDWTSGE